MEKISSAVSHSRSIRVFISSTFRDMQVERDILLKQVFPQLRKICEERGVNFTEVDLRWGITDEQSSEGQVLPICLEEIRNCRPFFIGIIGERYGWIPDSIPEDLKSREDWLQEKEMEKLSVTELEILHGVLNDPDMAEHAFFYFRDPAYLEKLEEKEQKDFCELPQSDEIAHVGQEKAEELAQLRRKKLSLLKDRIRNSGFPYKENYPNPEVLGDLVFRDMLQVIDKLFPINEDIDPLDKAFAIHENNAVNLARIFFGRESDLLHLKKQAYSGTIPMVVYGKAGIGKSAFLAKWMVDYRRKHPDEFVLIHFVGVSSESADWAAMLKRFMGEFKRKLNIQGEIPENEEALKEEFQLWLEEAAEKSRVILIIDGLDKLEDKEGGLDLTWLPKEIPENLCLILSTLPGRAQEALVKRNCAHFELDHLGEISRKELIVEYLGQYKKQLSQERVEKIVKSFQTGNPLFLRTLLEELRIFGIHELLDLKITEYLGSRKITDLFQMILKRYEQDYEKNRPGLVREVMSLLWASKSGLSETELLQLLGTKESPLPRAYWAPLFYAAEESLINRTGLVSIGNNYFRRAIRDLYLKEAKTQVETHKKLADYFGKMAPGPRKFDELPWHLQKVSDWAGLYELLGDMEFFNAAWKHNSNKVREYWASIEKNSTLRMVYAYEAILADPQSYEEQIWAVAELFKDSGYYPEALEIYHFLENKCRLENNEKVLSQVLGQMGRIYQIKSDYSASMKAFKEKENICRKLNDYSGLQSTLGAQAQLDTAHNNFDFAMKLCNEQERICRETKNQLGFQSCLGNKGEIYLKKYDFRAALPLFKEQEQICDFLSYYPGLKRVFTNLTSLFFLSGDYQEARKAARNLENISRISGDKAALQKALGFLAQIQYQFGELSDSYKNSKEQEKICLEIDDKAGLQAALGNQGKALLYMRSTQVSSNRLSVRLNQQSGVMGQAQFGPEAAMKLFIEQECICEESGLEEELQECRINQYNVICMTGNPTEAYRLLILQEEYWHKSKNQYARQNYYYHKGLFLFEAGKYFDSLQAFFGQHNICQLNNFRDGRRLALGRVTVLKMMMKKNQEAHKSAKEYQDLYIRIYGNVDKGLNHYLLEKGKDIPYLKNEHKFLFTLLYLCSEMEKEEAKKFHNKIAELKSNNDSAGISKLYIDQMNREGGLKNFVPELPFDLPVLDEIEITFDDLRKSQMRSFHNFDKRDKLFEEQERLGNILKDYDKIQLAVQKQARFIQVKKRDTEKALSLYKKQEKICRDHSILDGLQNSLYFQTEIYFEQKDFQTAQNLLDEQEKICRDTANKPGLQRALGKKGLIYFELGDLKKARELFLEQEKICRDFDIPSGLQDASGNLGLVCFYSGDLEKANVHFSEKEEICRKTGNRKAWRESINLLNLINIAQGELEAVIKNNIKKIDYFGEFDHQTILKQELNAQVIYLCALGKFEAARKYFSEQKKRFVYTKRLENSEKNVFFFLDGQSEVSINEEVQKELLAQYQKIKPIFQKSGNKKGLKTLLGLLAVLYSCQWDLKETLSVCKEQEELCREIKDQNTLRVNLLLQGGILSIRSEYQGALKLMLECEELCRDSDQKELLQLCLGNLGSLYLQLGKYDQAKYIFTEQEEICQTLSSIAGKQAAIGGMGMVLFYQGDTQNGMEYLQKQEALCRENNIKLGLFQCIKNQLVIYQDGGDEKQVITLEKELNQIANELGNLYFGLGKIQNSIESSYQLDKDPNMIFSLLENEAIILRRLDMPLILIKSLEKQLEICKEHKSKETELAVLTELEALYRKVQKNDDLQKCLGEIGDILLKSENKQKGLICFSEQEKICREIQNMFGLQKALGGQGSYWLDEGDLDKADKLFREQEKLCHDLDLEESLQICLVNRNLILMKKDEPELALNAFKNLETNFREKGKTDLIIENLLNQIQALMTVGKLQETLHLFIEIEDYYRKNQQHQSLLENYQLHLFVLCVLGAYSQARILSAEKAELQTSLQIGTDETQFIFCLLDGQGEVPFEKEFLITILSQQEKVSPRLTEKGEKEGLINSLGIRIFIKICFWEFDAELSNLFQEQINLCREIQDDRALINCLEKQSAVMFYQGKVKEALQGIKELKELSRKMDQKETLQIALWREAEILIQRNQSEAAFQLLREQEKICREIHSETGLQACQGTQGMAWLLTENLTQASKLFAEQEKSCRQKENLSGLIYSLGGQILCTSNNIKLSKLNSEQISICQKINQKYALILALETKMKLVLARSISGDYKLLLKQQEALCREIDNKELLKNNLGKQIEATKLKGKFEEVMALFIEQEAICREQEDKNSLQNSLGLQASFLYIKKNKAEAFEKYKEQEAICREIGNKAGLRQALLGEARFLFSEGSYEDALILFREHEKICREIGDENKLISTLGSMAEIYSRLGNLNTAMQLFAEVEKLSYGKSINRSAELNKYQGLENLIQAERGDHDGIFSMIFYKPGFCYKSGFSIPKSYALLNQKEIGFAYSLTEPAAEVLEREYSSNQFSKLSGELMIRRHRFGHGVANFLQSQEKICRENGFDFTLQECLGNQGVIKYQNKDFDAALRRFTEQEKICNEIGFQDGLQRALGRQAHILFEKNEWGKAQELLLKQEAICRELNNFMDLQDSLGLQAEILVQNGDFDSAQKKLAEMENICRKYFNNHALLKCLILQYLIRKEKEEFAAALQLLQEQEKLFDYMIDKSGEKIRIRARQGEMLFILGQFEESLRLFQSLEKESIRIKNRYILQLSHSFQGRILRENKDYNKAILHFEKQIQICRENNFTEDLLESLGQLGLTLIKTADFEGALEKFNELENLSKEKNDQAGLGESYLYQAMVYDALSKSGKKSALINKTLVINKARRIASKGNYQKLVEKINNFQKQGK